MKPQRLSARNPIVFKDLQARLRDLEAQLARRRAQHPKMLAAPWWNKFFYYTRSYIYIYKTHCNNPGADWHPGWGVDPMYTYIFVYMIMWLCVCICILVGCRMTFRINTLEVHFGQTLPIGSRESLTFYHPKDHSLFGRLDFQGICTSGPILATKPPRSPPMVV